MSLSARVYESTPRAVNLFDLSSVQTATDLQKTPEQILRFSVIPACRSFALKMTQR